MAHTVGFTLAFASMWSHAGSSHPGLPALAKYCDQAAGVKEQLPDISTSDPKPGDGKDFRQSSFY